MLMTSDTGMTGDEKPPEGLQDFASRRLVQAILAGRLTPGERVSPTKLAGELGVSHIPVREALASLEASGYVVRVPRVGYFITELSPGFIEDVYHWRQVLEDEAHRIAVPRLQGADLARMRTVNDSIRRAVELQDNSVIDLNREFHFIVFERAESEILLRFLNHLWDAAARYQATMTSMTPPDTLMHDLPDEHDALMEAFESRDINLVNARMAEHRYGTLRAIRELAAAHDAKLSSLDPDVVRSKHSTKTRDEAIQKRSEARTRKRG